MIQPKHLTVIVSAIFATLGTIVLSAHLYGDRQHDQQASSENGAPTRQLTYEKPESSMINGLSGQSELASTADTSATRAQIAELRAKLETMEGQAGLASQDESPVLHGEELNAANLAEHHRLVQAVQAQPIDSSWAPATQAKLMSDYQTAAQSNPTVSNAGRIQNVDCRSTGCVVSIEWPSHQAALNNWSKVMETRMSVNCVREIFIEDANGTSGPHVAHMVLSDCDK